MQSVDIISVDTMHLFFGILSLQRRMGAWCFCAVDANVEQMSTVWEFGRQSNPPAPRLETCMAGFRLESNLLHEYSQIVENIICDQNIALSSWVKYENPFRVTHFIFKIF